MSKFVPLAEHQFAVTSIPGVDMKLPWQDREAFTRLDRFLNSADFVVGSALENFESLGSGKVHMFGNIRPGIGEAGNFKITSPSPSFPHRSRRPLCGTW